MCLVSLQNFIQWQWHQRLGQEHVTGLIQLQNSEWQTLFKSAYHPSGYNASEFSGLMSTSSAIFQQNLPSFQLFQLTQSVLTEFGGDTFSCCEKNAHLSERWNLGIAVTWLLQNEVGAWPHLMGRPGIKGWAPSHFWLLCLLGKQNPRTVAFSVAWSGMSRGMIEWFSPIPPLGWLRQAKCCYVFRILSKKEKEGN